MHFLSRLIAYFATYTTLIKFLCEISVGWSVFKKLRFMEVRDSNRFKRPFAALKS